MPGTIDQQRLSAAIAAGRVEWRLHTVARLAERGIRQGDVLAAARTGAQIEDYPDAYPLPCALFLGAGHDGRPLHAVAGYDHVRDFAYILTAYIPDLDHFEADFKTRRKP